MDLLYNYLDDIFNLYIFVYIYSNFFYCFILLKIIVNIIVMNDFDINKKMNKLKKIKSWNYWSL